MKKYLILPAIIGLVAVPSLAFAQHDSSTKPVATIGQGVGTSITKPMLADTDADDTTAATTTAPTSTTPTTTTSMTDETKPPITVPDGSITADQAKAIAISLNPNKTFTKVETEMEHGLLVYEVKFTDGTEVTILASDSSVIANETGHTSLRTPNANANAHAFTKHNEGNHFGQLKHDD